MKFSDFITEFNRANIANGHNPTMTGFGEIDALCHGWKPGELCVIGGRPGMGKTAFVLSVMRNMVRDGMPAALFTATDSSSLVFLSRIACNLTDRTIYWKKVDSLNLLSTADLSSLPFYLYTNFKLSIEYLRQNIQELVYENNVKCVFIETIQALLFGNLGGYSRGNMETICRELKQLAIDFNITIVVTSELNRGTEHRDGFEGKRPQIQDIRLSDAIENIADSIWFLFRPEYYKVLVDENGNDLHGKAIVIIEKNKYGTCGDAVLSFDANKCSFENIKL